MPAQITGYKRRGEDHLRQSGLGYTVIRPGMVGAAWRALRRLPLPGRGEPPGATAARPPGSPRPPHPAHPAPTLPPAPPAGPLVEEPGGYKALVFDQGSRIEQSISYADVADICVRALHEVQARNKTFDVCYEYQSSEGLQLYELIAAVPGNTVNYLAPALSSLAKNT